MYMGLNRFGFRRIALVTGVEDKMQGIGLNTAKRREAFPMFPARNAGAGLSRRKTGALLHE